MKKYAVIGMGRFGQSIATELTNMDNEVLCVDQHEENLQEIQDDVTHVVVADATDEDSLRALGLEEYDGVIISIGNNIEASVLCAIICKDIGVKKLWAKASVVLQKKILKKIGVDRIILPEREMGVRIAHQVTNNSVVDYISLSEDYQLVELNTKQEWVGKTISEINFRTKYGINIIGIRHKEDFIVSPRADHKIQAGDILSIIGKNADIENI